MGFMNKDEIIQILKIVAESTLDELHLETGDLKLVLKKHRKMEPGRETDVAPREGIMVPSPASSSEPRRDQGVDMTPPAPPAMSAEKQTCAVVPEAEGFIAIRAPMLGTFYRAPKPEAPPFVEVGQWVTEEDVVCIIEVMKLFNTVKAGVRGRVAEICAENAQMVEYKQVLFLIEEVPEDRPGEEHTA